MCNSFTPEQRAQISTPLYKIKKEKREAKRVDNTQPTDELVDPSSVSIIGVVSGPSADKSPAPPEKKPKKDKPPTKSKKSSSALSSAMEDKFSALEDKWADRFNRLEALLLARSIEPTFSSDVRVAPDHPPGNVTRDSEPFFQPSDKPLDISQRTGTDSSAALHPSAGKLTTDRALQESSTVPNVALTVPVGARRQNFWQTWLDLGAGPKVVQILQKGYTLPFRIRPKLTRVSTVISCYANPLRNSYLLEALHQLIDKNAVEPVSNQTSLGFYNRLFLVPKPNNKWRPILDLSNLNQFLKVEKFKMETPETIKTSLL